MIPAALREDRPIYNRFQIRSGVVLPSLTPISGDRS